MGATMEAVPVSDREDQKRRPGALIWFFRKIRDGWKRKYWDLESTEKGYKNRFADLTKSREPWRLNADQAGERRSVSEAEKDAMWAQSVDEPKGSREVAR